MRVPPRPSGLLDVFEVRPQNRGRDSLATLRTEIATLLATLAAGQADEARGRVVDAVSGRCARKRGRGALLAGDRRHPTAEGHTLLRISGRTRRLPLRLTNALALST
jgi:hypothetical protein